MKARNLTVLAVVATGALALSASSALAVDAQSAKSKSDTRQDKDIKRLSENVNSLRKGEDETNFRITSIVEGLSPVLSQLGDAAKSYGNFQYGFVQLAVTGLPGGAAPQTYFLETPRLDPTSATSTVTKSFAFVPFAAAGWTNGRLQLRVGARSLSDPDKLDKTSSVLCNAMASQGDLTGLSKKNTDLPAKAQLPYYFVQRSPLVPTDSSENVASLVGQTSSDKMINFLDSSRASGVNTATGAAGGLVSNDITATGGNVQVSLSCMVIDNATLKDAGITSPFAD